MPNDTMIKFGYPDSCLREYNHWCVLLRPQQISAGCMVLACKDAIYSIGGLSAEAAVELPLVVGDLEKALQATFAPEKINYLALMMVDPHVHFHVIPRYSHPVRVGSSDVVDGSWPKPPDFQSVASLSSADTEALFRTLQDAWPTDPGAR